MSLARAYGAADVIDYGEHRAGRGLLLATGAGMMMSAMDMLPHARWAVDVGGGRGLDQRWLTASAHLVSHVLVAAWFTVTDPAPFAEKLRATIAEHRVMVYSQPGLGFGYQVASLEELALVSHLFSMVY